MNEFQGTAIVMALFALRCVMPFVLMLALGYGMKRLVRHWDGEGAGQSHSPAYGRPPGEQAGHTRAPLLGAEKLRRENTRHLPGLYQPVAGLLGGAPAGRRASSGAMRRLRPLHGHSLIRRRGLSRRIVSRPSSADGSPLVLRHSHDIRHTRQVTIGAGKRRALAYNKEDL